MLAGLHAARHGKGRVAKLVLLGAVPPIMVKTPANPGGLPLEVLDEFPKAARCEPRTVLSRCASPFYSFNRPGAKTLQSVVDTWWRQGMMGGARHTTTASRPSRKPTSRRT